MINEMGLGRVCVCVEGGVGAYLARNNGKCHC